MTTYCHACEKEIVTEEDQAAYNEFDTDLCAKCLETYDTCVKELIIHPVLALSF